MGDADLPRDPHAAARSNIRETMKWLIAGFAGMAAAIVGTSPLTGLGSPMPLWRLLLAIGGGVLGLLLIGIAIAIALRILVTRPFFFADVAANDELRTVVDQHRDDLLPPECANYDAFRKERSDAIAVLRGSAAGDRDKALATYEQGGVWVDQIVSFAYFETMRRQLGTATRWLFGLAFLAALAFAVFAWAANPKKPEAPTGKVALLAIATRSHRHM